MEHVPFLYTPRLTACVLLLRSLPVSLGMTLIGSILLDHTNLVWYEWFVVTLAALGWAVTAGAFSVLFVAGLGASVGPDRRDEGSINNRLWREAWQRVWLRPRAHRWFRMRRAGGGHS